MSDAPNLDEIAEQELLNEAKRGAARASLYGALGWQKCPLKPTNKIFLQNMLLSTISSNSHREPDVGLQKDNMKRKADDFGPKHSGGFKRVVPADKKSASHTGRTNEDLNSNRGSSASSEKSDSQLGSSAEKDRARCLSSVSVSDLRQLDKKRQTLQKSKSVTSVDCGRV